MSYCARAFALVMFALSLPATAAETCSDIPTGTQPPRCGPRENEQCWGQHCSYEYTCTGPTTTYKRLCTYHPDPSDVTDDPTGTAEDPEAGTREGGGSGGGGGGSGNPGGSSTMTVPDPGGGYQTFTCTETRCTVTYHKT